ncbi:MAG: VanZ family protein [Spirochaetaceae bacterium]|nr:VanZ family protein [Spirochaetaceae bacterium]
MALFSSDRERRLWLWTLAVVVAIYSTLGLAQTLTRALLDSGLLGASFPLVSFLVAMFLVGATVVTHGLNARPGGVEIAVALGVTAAYALVFLRMVGPEERSHLIEYGVVAVFIHEALAERASQGRRVPALPLLAVLATAALGVVDECIQIFVPNRVFDPMDMVFTCSRPRWRWVRASRCRGRGAGREPAGCAATAALLGNQIGTIDLDPPRDGRRR